MKISTTSERLKEYMSKYNLRQVDILEKVKPYCDEYDVKMNKSDLSQYVSGKTEPGQDKLVVLAKALHVSEPWLMGYDVPEITEVVNYTHETIPDDLIILNRNAKNLTSEQRKQLIDMAKIMFKEDWND